MPDIRRFVLLKAGPRIGLPQPCSAGHREAASQKPTKLVMRVTEYMLHRRDVAGGDILASLDDIFLQADVDIALVRQVHTITACIRSPSLQFRTKHLPCDALQHFISQRLQSW